MLTSAPADNQDLHLDFLKFERCLAPTPG
jgi:hypothetical protein